MKVFYLFMCGKDIGTGACDVCMYVLLHTLVSLYLRRTQVDSLVFIYTNSFDNCSDVYTLFLSTDGGALVSCLLVVITLIPFLSIE